MNPYKLKDVFNYLTSNNQLLKRKLKLGTDDIPIPPKRDDVTAIEAINRFNKDNPRVDTTDIQPVVKQSAIKQSNVGEVDEGVIQGAFDTATMEARDGGYPPPIYETFKKRYLKRNMKADGGRIGYNEGSKLTDFLDVQASGSKSGKQQIKGAPKGITSDRETINAIVRLDVPIYEKIDLLATYGYGKDRTKYENKGEELFLGEGGYKDRNIQLDYNRGGEGFSGSVNYGIDSEEPQLNIRYKKSFADGGMLVQPSDDGSRPGDAGPKKDSDVIAKKIDEVNKGLKFYTYDSLAKEIPGFNSGSNLQIYIKNNNLSKLDTFPKKVEKAWISLFEDGDKAAQTVYKPLFKIRELVGGGQKDYGTGATKRTRTEHISKALKESDLLVWDDIKPIISKLNSDNFINSLDRKGIDYTIADVEYSAYNKTGMLRAPKTDAEHLMDYVIRHANQSDSPVYSIYDSKTNKRITDLKNVDSYHDIYFKSESPFKDTTNYDMEYLKTKARKDPLFKEYFNLQDELFEMKNKKYWPDGSRIIDPKTGKGTTFGNWSGSLNKHGYGYTKSFERFPYDTDHRFGVAKHPFKDLAILPQRINIALGSVMQKNRGDLSKKIGADHFRNLSVDDLMMQEKEFGKKILIFDADGNHVGKKLETPYQNAKRIVKYYNDLDLSKAGKGPKPEFPLSDFQKPDQAVPIKKRLETFKNEKKANILSAFCNSKRKNLKLAGSVDGLTCSMEEIQTNMQKQIDEAAKVSKDGKIPKKFGKLKAFAGSFFGDVAIPLEYMFAAPYLAAGDIEGAKRATTAGLFGYGKVDLDKLPEGEGQRFLKHINALNSFMDNYASKTMAENELENSIDDESRFILTNRISEAAKNMKDISLDYQTYGYDGQKGLLQGKVAAQQLIRDQVQSDYNKKINKATSTEFFKDSDKELLESNIRYGDKENDPNQVTPITDLESYIRNKGEATAGNTNLFFDVKPYTLNRAEAYGVPDIFDQYAGGYAGVETPGFIRETGEVDMGTKDVRDAYSSLPINMASQLAALEKKEFEEGMIKKDLEQRFASGGIASLTDTIPPESGPTPHGLPYVYNNVKKI